MFLKVSEFVRSYVTNSLMKMKKLPCQGYSPVETPSRGELLKNIENVELSLVAL